MNNKNNIFGTSLKSSSSGVLKNNGISHFHSINIYIYIYIN